MNNGFPCLAICLLAVLGIHLSYGLMQTSTTETTTTTTTTTATTASPRQSVVVTSQLPNQDLANQLIPSKNDTGKAKPANQNPSPLPRDQAALPNGGSRPLMPANRRRHFIVDTSDVDNNHDDCISGDTEMAEFTKRVASALVDGGNGEAHWRAVAISRRADVNGDGKICWCDFIAIFLKGHVLGQNHEFPFVVVPDDVMFTQLDANKDGKLEGKERDDLQQQFASCMNPHQAKSITGAMSLMRDLDQSITIEEYRDFFKQRFVPHRWDDSAKQTTLQQQQHQQQPQQQQQQQQQLMQHRQQQQQQQQRQEQTPESQWQHELQQLQAHATSPKRPQHQRMPEQKPNIPNKPTEPLLQKLQHQTKQQQESELLELQLEQQQQQQQQREHLQQHEQFQQLKQTPQNAEEDQHKPTKSIKFYQMWYRQQLDKLAHSQNNNRHQQQQQKQQRPAPYPVPSQVGSPISSIQTASNREAIGTAGKNTKSAQGKELQQEQEVKPLELPKTQRPEPTPNVNSKQKTEDLKPRISSINM